MQTIITIFTYGNKGFTTTKSIMQGVKVSIWTSTQLSCIRKSESRHVASFFSDFGASFTDLFGGYSDTYQNKLQEIYKVAIDKLKQKAATVGANAIVGFKIDFDEISDKGKSMFMISALGMAVTLRYRII